MGFAAFMQFFSWWVLSAGRSNCTSRPAWPEMFGWGSQCHFQGEVGGVQIMIQSQLQLEISVWFTTQTVPCSHFLTTRCVQSPSGHLQTVVALRQCDIRSVSDHSSNINIHMCICYLISSFAFSISLWAYFNTGQTPGENRLGSLNSANSCSSTEKQVCSWKDSTELYRKAPSFSFNNKTICSNTDTKAGAVTGACRTIAWTAHKPTQKQDEAQLQHCVVTAENCC